MRVFLAGATGVIGRRLVPLLAGRGHSVTGLVRRPADAGWLRGLGASAVLGDVFDADGVRRAVALAAPEVVMHQLTDLKGGNRRANSEMRITGTRHLVDAALAAGVRRIVAQSIAWAYEPGTVPAAEDVPLDLGAEESRLRTVQGVAAGREWVPAFCRAVGVREPVVAVGRERHGWARGASNRFARTTLNWTPAWPSWREGFGAL